jgi:Zn-dependent protease
MSPDIANCYTKLMFSDLSGAYILVFIVSLVLALSIHEAMHGFVAHWLGDDTAQLEGRLTLNPLAHIDLATTILLPTILVILHLPPILAAKPVPFNPARVKWDEFGAALIGVAGPLTNLVLAAVAALIFRVLGANLSSFLDNSLQLFAAVNVGLFVFNMIPIPPLDGSRLLYAFAPEPLQDIMRQIEAMGFLVILFILLFAFPLISGPLSSVYQAILTFLLG